MKTITQRNESRNSLSSETLSQSTIAQTYLHSQLSLLRGGGKNDFLAFLIRQKQNKDFKQSNA